jgi:hypothetical protein
MLLCWVPTTPAKLPFCLKKAQRMPRLRVAARSASTKRTFSMTYCSHFRGLPVLYASSIIELRADVSSLPNALPRRIVENWTRIATFKRHCRLKAIISNYFVTTKQYNYACKLTVYIRHLYGYISAIKNIFTSPEHLTSSFPPFRPRFPRTNRCPRPASRQAWRQNRGGETTPRC